jgi:phage terminase large subunit GpA-like protein
VSIRQVTESFLSAKSNPETLKTWVNTSLGETWEEGGETVDPAAIETRGEIYDYATLPDGIVALAAGVDVHDDRIEMQVIGWGHKEEAWACRYEVIHGDPSQAKVWDELDALLLEQGKTEAGRLLRIRAACVDVGGHHGERVLAFCRPRRARRVFAVKGRAGPWPVWPKRATRSKTNDQIFLVGVDTAKDAIYGRLKIVAPGPSYVHFPAEEGFDKSYFRQLTSERVQTRYKEGRCSGGAIVGHGAAA